MPRKTPIRELQLTESALISSPVRRSNRINSTGSATPSSKSNPEVGLRPVSTPRILRGRKPSVQSVEEDVAEASPKTTIKGKNQEKASPAVTVTEGETSAENTEDSVQSKEELPVKRSRSRLGSTSTQTTKEAAASKVKPPAKRKNSKTIHDNKVNKANSSDDEAPKKTVRKTSRAKALDVPSTKPAKSDEDSSLPVKATTRQATRKKSITKPADNAVQKEETNTEDVQETSEGDEMPVKKANIRKNSIKSQSSKISINEENISSPRVTRAKNLPLGKDPKTTDKKTENEGEIKPAGKKSTTKKDTIIVAEEEVQSTKETINSDLDNGKESIEINSENQKAPIRRRRSRGKKDDSNVIQVIETKEDAVQSKNIKNNEEKINVQAPDQSEVRLDSVKMSHELPEEDNATENTTTLQQSEASSKSLELSTSEKVNDQELGNKKFVKFSLEKGNTNNRPRSNSLEATAPRSPVIQIKRRMSFEESLEIEDSFKSSVQSASSDIPLPPVNKVIEKVKFNLSNINERSLETSIGSGKKETTNTRPRSFTNMSVDEGESGEIHDDEDQSFSFHLSVSIESDGARNSPSNATETKTSQKLDCNSPKLPNNTSTDVFQFDESAVELSLSKEIELLASPMVTNDDKVTHIEEAKSVDEVNSDLDEFLGKEIYTASYNIHVMKVDDVKSEKVSKRLSDEPNKQLEKVTPQDIESADDVKSDASKPVSLKDNNCMKEDAEVMEIQEQSESEITTALDISNDLVKEDVLSVSEIMEALHSERENNTATITAGKNSRSKEQVNGGIIKSVPESPLETFKRDVEPIGDDKDDQTSIDANIAKYTALPLATQKEEDSNVVTKDLHKNTEVEVETVQIGTLEASQQVKSVEVVTGKENSFKIPNTNVVDPDVSINEENSRLDSDTVLDKDVNKEVMPGVQTPENSSEELILNDSVLEEEGEEEEEESSGDDTADDLDSLKVDWGDENSWDSDDADDPTFNPPEDSDEVFEIEGSPDDEERPSKKTVGFFTGSFNSSDELKQRNREEKKNLSLTSRVLTPGKVLFRTSKRTPIPSNRNNASRTSINITEDLDGQAENTKIVTGRIHKVVDMFCEGIQSNKGEVSINVSLDFTGRNSTPAEIDDFRMSGPPSEEEDQDVAIQNPTIQNDHAEGNRSKRRKLFHVAFQNLGECFPIEPKICFDSDDKNVMTSTPSAENTIGNQVEDQFSNVKANAELVNDVQHEFVPQDKCTDSANKSKDAHEVGARKFGMGLVKRSKKISKISRNDREKLKLVKILRNWDVECLTVQPSLQN